MKKICFVCRKVYNFSDEIVCVNSCGHIYHFECSDEWKNIANFCFKCGQEIESITNILKGPYHEFGQIIENKEHTEKINKVKELAMQLEYKKTFDEFLYQISDDGEMLRGKRLNEVIVINDDEDCEESENDLRLKKRKMIFEGIMANVFEN